jgi:hypothetical protein
MYFKNLSLKIRFFVTLVTFLYDYLTVKKLRFLNLLFFKAVAETKCLQVICVHENCAEISQEQGKEWKKGFY